MDPSMTRCISAVLVALSVAGVAAAEVTPQLGVARIDLMPNLPQPYQMRDWKQVTRDFDARAYDVTATGDYLPLIWYEDSQINYPFEGYGLASYVGHFYSGDGIPREAGSCLSSVVGALQVGIDKTNQHGRDYVRMSQHFYNIANGEGVILNNASAHSAGNFNYVVLPTIFFYKLVDVCPGGGDPPGELDAIMQAVSDRWYDAEVVMGGTAGGYPNFNYLAFDFRTMTPVSDPKPRPDAAAGIAWLEYMAHVKFGDAKYLQGADWGMTFLENQTKNPLTHCTLAFGAYLAARMNAELGRNYDTARLLDWTFGPSDGTARPGWGITAKAWNGVDAAGLMGQNNDQFAFAYETFETAGALIPLPRYDQRYARAIGKYVLNAANSARLLYANAHDAEHQSNKAWADAFDPCYCMTYEGVREFGFLADGVVADVATARGSVISGTYADTVYHDPDSRQILQEAIIAGGKDALEHTWALALRPGTNRWLFVDAYRLDGGDADTGFDFSYARDPAGPFSPMFTVQRTTDDGAFHQFYLGDGPAETIYLRVEDDNRVGGNYLVDALLVRSINVRSDTTLGPYGLGDASKLQWSRAYTDYAPYGAAHVGAMAAALDLTDVPGILRLDLNATDYFQNTAYPTYLYYNPHDDACQVALDVGPAPCDLYETISKRFLAVGVTGVQPLRLGSDEAIVVVLAPAGGAITVVDDKKLINGVVVDYRRNHTYDDCGQWRASPQRLPADLNGDCAVDGADLAVLTGQWTEGLPGPGAPGDLNRDAVVDLVDFAVLSGTWMTSIP